MPRFKDTFEAGDLSSEHSESSESTKSTGSEKMQAARKKRKLEEPSLEALQDAGYRSGPSILTMKERAEPQTYEWGKGKHGDSDKSEEDYETREETRAAATYGTDAAVQQALKSKQQLAAKLAEERAEHAEAQQKRRETFQQREKRKRDIGQAKKGKNYVEDEKRLLRQHNIYSGFDN